MGNPTSAYNDGGDLQHVSDMTSNLPSAVLLPKGIHHLPRGGVPEELCLRVAKDLEKSGAWRFVPRVINDTVDIGGYWENDPSLREPELASSLKELRPIIRHLVDEKV